MLIDPSLEQLLTKADSKFSIVSMVAKRVRELNDGWAPLLEQGELKPVSLALREIAEGKLSMVSGDARHEQNKAEAENA
ncbi:MAG: DNA-directed RNA polymerase subunit omega [bacterium]|nr:DNA-directed RNA polymerase subunit omega [bacterium]